MYKLLITALSVFIFNVFTNSAYAVNFRLSAEIVKHSMDPLSPRVDYIMVTLPEDEKIKIDFNSLLESDSDSYLIVDDFHLLGYPQRFPIAWQAFVRDGDTDKPLEGTRVYQIETKDQLGKILNAIKISFFFDPKDHRFRSNVLISRRTIPSLLVLCARTIAENLNLHPGLDRETVRAGISPDALEEIQGQDPTLGECFE
jgi:hypothetical protein